MIVEIRVEHSPTGEREDRRFRAGGTTDLSVAPYSYLTDDLSVYVGLSKPAIRVTSLVDSEVSDLYDEIMAADPATRTAAQERFIEYVAERLVAEVGGSNEEDPR